MSDIYISGYSGRFPDCDNVHQLFQKLYNKEDCVSASKRYPSGYLGLPNRAGHLNEIDKFDNMFFKLNKTHVEGIDIQIRMLLEVVYESLVDSNLSIETIKNTNMGVYVGNCFSDYHNGIMQNIHNVNGYENLGSALSMSANKISHFFDLNGPSIVVDTACSSSLHALSIACNDIQSGKIDKAIVAGVSLNLRPVISSVFQKYNMLSPDGICYAFDDKANGYCRSESINALILQKNSGYVKIIGHGINSNGATEQGITFPNVDKQELLFKQICDNFKIDKSKIEYIEAHGTGTTAGDNVEINALNKVYCNDNKTINIGSIKSNLGHAEGASGINSIIKCLMSYETGVLLPNIHYNSTSHLPIKNNRFNVITELTPFNRGYSVINNFGFGGTNAHVILANGNYTYKNTENNNIVKVLTRTKADCEKLLQSNDNNLNNKFYENIIDKNKFPYSGAKIGDFTVIKSSTSIPKLCYIYSGQGSNYNHMGKELYSNNAIFTETISRLHDYLLEISNGQYKLKDLFIDGNQWIDKIYSSIGITSVQIGITNILNSQGYKPDYIIGHSMGEIGCSYADNCLTEKQCIKISYIRSLMVDLIDKNTYFYNFENELPDCKDNLIIILHNEIFVYKIDKSKSVNFEKFNPNFINKLDNHGKMLFVSADEESVKQYLQHYPNVSIACYNSVDGLTLSGPFDDVSQIENNLNNNKVFNKVVETDGIAYHSVLLAPYFDYLHDNFLQVIPNPIKRSSKWLSTCDSNQNYCDAKYHTTNIVSSVLFNQQIMNLPKDEVIAFLEISPNEGLLGQIKRSRKENNILITTLSKKTLEQHSLDIQKMFCHLWANKVMTEKNENLNDEFIQLPLKNRYNIKWDHETKWKTVSYLDFESENNNSICVYYDLKNNYNFLLDHQIQGQALFPAMGHIFTIWQIVGLKNKLSVANFNILKAIVLTQDINELKFNVKNINNLYNIYYDDEVVANATATVNAKATVNKNLDVNLEILEDLADLKNNNLKIDKYQFYGQLSRLGYEYKNTFRMIENVDDDKITINDTYHWITLLDGMLQASIQNVDALYLPTHIDKIEINNPNLKLKDINILVNNKDIILADKSVYIYGLETTLAPNSHDNNPSVKQIVEWIGYNGEYVENGLDICCQIIKENLKDFSVYDMTPECKMFQYVENNVLQYNKSQMDVDVIFACNMYDDDLKLLETKINNNGFVLIEYDNINCSNNSNLKLVASYITKDHKYMLYRKIVVRQYKIIDSLDNLINFSDNIILNCNAASFVKSINKEPDYENCSIICAYSNLDNNKLVLEHAKDTQLLINIENNGKIGSYRMIDDYSYNNVNKEFEIRINKPGNLQSLTLYESIKGNIDVNYVGLNFKDVMQSYGKLKIKNIQLGLEFSGKNLNKDENVMGMGLGLFKSSINADKVISWKVPKTWSLQEAATVPCVYGTVYYALDYKCKIEKGQSILIHAGAGGIGQSAIHLCLLRGLKVYTTCSENKRQFLKDRFNLKDNQIGNSRDNSFFNWIMKENNGVDIVLNSLSEDKLLLSIQCLKPFGQFCEIGKFDILQNNGVGLKLFENNISLHVIDLSTMFEHNDFKHLLRALVQNGLDKNEIVPLNIDKMYHYTKLDEAIRYMGSGKHTGKIIIEMIKQNDNIKIEQQFNTNGTHMITGGMGGFGLELAEWLIKQGASKILLVGRNGINNLYQKRKFDKYRELEYVKCDITNESDVKKLFSDYKINGIWHLAMKLNDQLYKNLNEQLWNETIDVKQKGAYLLNKYCNNNSMFVCWSSISSLFGNAGQSNYAHGNNMMEEICRTRRELGYHGLSICWGPIDNIGYLAQENTKINKLMFLPQNIDDCLNDLHKLLKCESAVVSCYKVNNEFNKNNTTKESTLVDSVMAILGINDYEKIDKNNKLTELGMDSLQSASIKTTLKKYGKKMEQNEILNLKVLDLY
jgi:acyl transferase domain-containing protein/NADPH:quinone reductase-like Zn-dependent oxidoreductase/NAD(P)-dependent dehydrogenase (short-subunit alcohol dehydrogenase family)